MSSSPLDAFRHEHVFLGEHHDRNARRTWAVIVLCTAMMVIEVAGGMLFGSMALLADGLHMSTHAGAMLIAALAYTFARRHARDPRYSFGTGKLGDLAAFTSAIVLAVVALGIGVESLERLLNPVAIRYNEALPVAVLGLLVNLASAWLLHDGHSHGHGHSHDHGHGHAEHHHHEGEHEHGHDHAHLGAHEHHDHDHADDRRGHHDLNLRAAYVHVIADAAVSILAIVGLLAGRQLGWSFMDPIMGVVGAVVIGNWSIGLIRDAGAVLLDMRPHGGLADRIARRLKVQGSVEICDLHVWRLGPGHHAAVVSLAAKEPLTPSAYKAKLRELRGLSHVTVEVEPWPEGGLARGAVDHDHHHDHGHDHHDHDHHHEH
jgi:cation diffusion facilitator family transporter